MHFRHVVCMGSEQNPNTTMYGQMDDTRLIRKSKKRQINNIRKGRVAMLYVRPVHVLPILLFYFYTAFEQIYMYVRHIPRHQATSPVVNDMVIS